MGIRKYSKTFENIQKLSKNIQKLTQNIRKYSTILDADYADYGYFNTISNKSQKNG